jgi:hypothetical protein
MEFLSKIFRGRGSVEKTDKLRQQQLGAVRAELVRLSEVPVEERGEGWEDQVRLEGTIYRHLRCGDGDLPEEIELDEGPITVPIIGGNSINLPAKRDRINPSITDGN